MSGNTENSDKTLSKSEILRSKKIIQELFSEGSSFYLYPFRVKFLGQLPSGERPQILITVPKKIFKRAVDRNQIKRRIKEAYRLNKGILIEAGVKAPQYLGFIYTPKEKISFEMMEKKLILTLQRLISETGN